jgi:hypothetical protein
VSQHYVTEHPIYFDDRLERYQKIKNTVYILFIFLIFIL